MEPIRVAVVGAVGRMGSEVIRYLSKCSGIRLVAAIDKDEVGRRTRELFGADVVDLEIQARLGAALDLTPADVLVDFTTASAAADHAFSAIKRGVAPIIGSSGFDPQNVRALRECCDEYSVPAAIIPNFAIGAVLMIRLAQIAAKWMPDAEIIEMHHDQKVDAPSGTSIYTAESLSTARERTVYPNAPQSMPYENARGAVVKSIPVHSVRLKGMVAHQRVIFGGDGEVLTISHDSLDRSSFMQGVELAVRRIRDHKGLVVGLDKLMFEEAN